MSRWKTVGIVAGVGVLGVGVVVGGVATWAVMARDAKLAETRTDVHRHEFPIPFPLSEAEVAELRAQKAAELAATAPAADPAAPVDPAAAAPDPLAGVDLDAIAKERAVARAKHLLESRIPCMECHGHDFGGGVMVDDPAMGRFLGPNLTLGKGSVTANYTAADWDRMVRHGVQPDGTGSLMPSKDFYEMSDQELSDIVTYIRSLPPVDNDVPPVSYGPIATMLIATGRIEFSMNQHPDHAATHPVRPPEAKPDATYGRHLMMTCSGCHRRDFNGGPIVEGPPDWPPAANLTPAGDLKGWTAEDFRRALREARRPDGTQLKAPMSLVPKFADKMTDVEIEAMWAYLQTLPATPTGT